MKRKLALFALGVAVLAAVAAAFLRYDDSRAGDAWIKCKDVKPGMTLEEAGRIMGTAYREAGSDDKGRRMLMFKAPMFADTIPVLYVDSKTKVVQDVACQ